MKVTIVTLYRGVSCNTYVGAVSGSLSERQRRDFAKSLQLATDDLDGEDDVVDQLGFTEVEISNNLPEISLSNAYSEVYTGLKEHHDT